jgi:acetoin utilization deacetylase AcuC-like enzyme
MGKLKLVYSKQYFVELGEHVFPVEKYGLIYDQLIREGIAEEDDFLSPRPCTDQEILLVHTQEYLQKLEREDLSLDEVMTLELPFSREIFQAARLAAGGTILACREALRNQVCIHIGGGFHHAFPDHGEGFCVFNDVAIGTKVILNEGLARKVLVLDCDLHHGNGTAFIFRDTPSVFTFSIHQEQNYPIYKPRSDLDIGLPDGVDDESYLTALSKNCEDVFSEFGPDFLLYIAGADPYLDDKLGGLSLTKEGLRRRDEWVFKAALRRGIPICACLGGGYARNPQDTVDIHVSLVKTACLALCKERGA